MKKRFSGVLICLVSVMLLILSMPQPSVFGAIKSESGDFEYISVGGKVTITSYNGTSSSVTIPEKIDGVSVTCIGESAFEGNEYLESIKIPHSVKIIKDNAFEGCSNLSDVHYESTEKNWDEISIGSGNRNLKNADFHFKSISTGTKFLAMAIVVLILIIIIKMWIVIIRKIRE